MGIREKLHHGDDEPPVDPNSHHEFRRLSDNWVGHGVAPVSTLGAGGGMGAATGAAYQFTGEECGICRRPADDPIHEPAD